MSNKQWVLLALLLVSLAIFWGCGAGGDAVPPTTTTTTTTPTSTTSNAIVLSLSQNSVETDGSDSSTVTATVIQNNVPQEGVTVNFATTAGLISVGSVTTDSNGRASVTFYANPGDRSNQVATITATSGGLSQTIPITITGTIINLAATQTQVSVGGTTTLTINVLDAGSVGINSATVDLSTSNANVALSATTGTTNTSGVLTVILNGAVTGTTVITVSSSGATQTITITVGASASSINITNPATSPYVIVTGIPQVVTITGPFNTDVTFVSTLGTWGGGAATEIQTTDGAGVASATLTSDLVGTATVMVYQTSTPGNSDSTLINVSPPIGDANQVAVSFSATSVAPSSATVTNSVTVYAKVITDSSEPIANVPVTFSLSNTTGGGEYVSPASAVTDSSGYATTTFYSGTSSSSGLGVNVIATEHGSASPGNSDTGTIIIGGTPASIVLSRGTHATASGDNTYYIMPMGVLVSDSGGGAVANATVSLTAWPTRYRIGTGGPPTIQEVPPTGSLVYSVVNEDANRNLILDAGEDVGPCDDLSACTALAADGVLTPPSAAAGSVPSSVTTIANGTGAFNLTYLKSSAVWIEDEITATVKVLGTESKTSLTFWLPYLTSDEDLIPSSPYGHL
ncbi:MAG: Ig-like domain-containing protein [Proteobacteria bacterium]|nr:Ig-like domain-containing protein [Pseudomonadota bacterium]MBU1738949.1 Ig-like domain-containing protein [Pseudomonadota bacterium]